MARQVHVVDDDHPTRPQICDGLAKLKDRTPGGVWKDQVERAKCPDEVGAVTLHYRRPFRPARSSHLRCSPRIEFDTDHFDIVDKHV